MTEDNQPSKIKVQLCFPTRYTDSTYYNSLIENPPEGIEYVSDIKPGLIGNTVRRGVFKTVKRIVRKTFSKIGTSRPLFSIKSKNLLSPSHYAHCVPKKSNGKFIIDLEGVWQLAVGRMTSRSRYKILKRLSSEDCTAILPWTNAAALEFVKVFPEVGDKTNVMYPAVPLRRGEHKTLTTGFFIPLYIARDFNLKNGPLVCEVMENLVKSLSEKNIVVKPIIISNVKEKVKKKYPNITFLDLMPKEDLEKFYDLADVFVYPSPIDTFGFSIIEAMSHGLPTIAMKTDSTKALPEIINNGVNGFFFSEENYAEATEVVISSLIRNKDYYEIISKNCIIEVEVGKFSIYQRNKFLKNLINSMV